MITHTNLQMSSKMFPLQEKLEYFCFLLFLVFCAGCGLYVKFYIPETKNRTVLEIAAEFERMHCKPEVSQRKTSTKQKLSGMKTYDTKF